MRDNFKTAGTCIMGLGLLLISAPMFLGAPALVDIGRDVALGVCAFVIGLVIYRYGRGRSPAIYVAKNRCSRAAGDLMVIEDVEESWQAIQKSDRILSISFDPAARR